MADPENKPFEKSLNDVSESVLCQIRTLLVDAGVTASMLNLPDDDDNDNHEISPSNRLSQTETTENIGQGRSLNRIYSSLTDPLQTFDKMASRKDRGIGSYLDKRKRYPIAEDLYNLFWISGANTLSFWYAIISMSINYSLESIVLFWIYRQGGFRDEQLADFPPPAVVNVAKFLLIPVAVGITEELMLTLDTTKMKWAKLDKYPHATHKKYLVSNFLRLLDGLAWLFICISLMVFATDVLNMFLNFAALQFLQSVDNAAYAMAKGGYLTDSLEQTAREVAKITLPSARATWMDYVDTLLLLSVLIGVLIYCAVIVLTPHGIQGVSQYDINLLNAVSI